MKRKRRPLLTAFCIPVAIMIAAVIYKEIYPFGDRCFLRVDLYNQYLPFFTELQRKLQEGGSLFLEHPYQGIYEMDGSLGVWMQNRLALGPSGLKTTKWE